LAPPQACAPQGVAPDAVHATYVELNFADSVFLRLSLFTHGQSLPVVVCPLDADGPP